MHVVLDKEKLCIGSVWGLNLTVVRPTTPTTFQVINCSFRVAAQALIDSKPFLPCTNVT
jgi:hypothetical protein